MTYAGGKQKWWRLKVSMVGDERVSSGIEFLMTAAAEQKEREPKLVLDGVGELFHEKWC